MNSGHSNSTRPGILLDLIQMINQVHHLDPFAQVCEHYMSIMKQVEKHKRIIYWALLHSIMGQNWSIICQGLSMVGRDVRTINGIDTTYHPNFRFSHHPEERGFASLAQLHTRRMRSIVGASLSEPNMHVQRRCAQGGVKRVCSRQLCALAA